MTISNDKNATSTGPIHSYNFDFEINFDPESAKKWVNGKCSEAVFICAVYAIVIFSLKHYMRNKRRFELRRALAVWNVGLAIFSILGTLRTLPELYHMLFDHGLHQSVCHSTILEPTNVTEFWAWVFALSKFVELGDTVFIVLRKQPLIFLHWYHHIVALLHTWIAYGDNVACFRWFRSMNYSVHSIMYSYYILKALGLSVPKFISMLITLAQILQMINGCVITYLGYLYYVNDQPCEISYKNILLNAGAYISYLILFSRFFYHMYINPHCKQYPPIYNETKIKKK